MISIIRELSLLGMLLSVTNILLLIIIALLYKNKEDKWKN